MFKRKIIVTSIGIIVLLSLAVVIQKMLSRSHKESKVAAVVENVRYVHAVPVEYKNLNSPILSQGRVLSKNIVLLCAEASGKLMTGNIPLKKGASFSIHQKLYQIYDKEERLSLKASKSEFLTIVAKMLPDIKVDFPDVYPTFYTFFQEIKLNEDLPDLPNLDIEQTNKLKTFLSTRSFLNSYFRIKQNELRLKRFSSYAPFNGTFISVAVEVGAYVNPGQTIAKMVDNSRLEIEVPLEARYLKWIHNGKEVQIFNEQNETIGLGRITRIAPFVDEGTQSVSVFVSIDRRENPNLFYGQYVKVSYNHFKVENVMRLPRSSVFNHDHVYIVQDSLLVKRNVTIVKNEEKMVLISGLPEGTMVVDEPLVDARENSLVRIINEAKQ